jgi:long-chain acyl-CoA synthetase
MRGRPPFTVEVPNAPKIKGETIPRRNIKYRDRLLARPAENIDTVWDLVTRSVETFAGQRCMGWRNLIKIHTETTHVKKIIDGVETEVPKEWTYLELSGYRYITFREYGDMVLRVGSGLRRLGLGRQDRVHIYAATR